jgi:hypothetical protein
MNTSQRTAILKELADGIARRRLTTPARIILDVIEPLGFLAGQLALFARPLTPLERWRAYLAALDDREGWKILHDIVER